MPGRAGLNPEVVLDLALIVLPLAALVIAWRMGREMPWLGLVLVAALTLPFLPIAALANGHPLFPGWVVASVWAGVCALALWGALHLQAWRTGWRWQAGLHLLILLPFGFFWAVFWMLQVQLRLHPMS